MSSDKILAPEPMTHEQALEAAHFHATKAFLAAGELEHGFCRDEARENLKAAIGWIKQARDEYLLRKAGQ